MNNKYVLISGAAGGIGTATSYFLADRGFTVFAGDKNADSLETMQHKRIVPLQMDITDVSSIQKAIRQIRETTDQLHALVNLAGMFDHFALMEANSETFKRLIDVNFMGQQQLTQQVFPLLKTARGRIVNMSSETVLALMPLQVYGFSKKLMDVWNTQLRMELNLLEMHVIAIRAGGHQTEFIRQSYEALGNISGLADYQGLKQKIMEQGQKMLAKKMADPTDIAKVIHKALIAERPKKYYHVNVSKLFRFLSWLPEGLREKLLIGQLKKWM